MLELYYLAPVKYTFSFPLAPNRDMNRTSMKQVLSKFNPKHHNSKIDTNIMWPKKDLLE